MTSHGGQQDLPCRHARPFSVNCGGSHAFRPRVKLVLGADKNRADVDTGEIQLVRWGHEATLAKAV